MDINLDNIDIKNKKLIIAVISIVILVIVTSVAAVGVIQYTEVLSDGEPEQKTIYDGVSEDTNVMIQFDGVGLVTNETTENLFQDVNQEFDSMYEDDFYEQEVNDLMDGMNEDINEELFTTFNYDIRDVENAVLFGNLDFDEIQEDFVEQDYANEQNDSEEPDDMVDDFGLLVHANISENELESSLRDGQIDYEFIQKEYGENTVMIIDEDNEDYDDIFMTVLDDKYIAVSYSEDKIENIIDTYEGQADSVDDNMIPSDSAHVSVNVGGIDGLYTETIDMYEEMYRQYGFEAMLEEEEQEEMERFFDMPAPTNVAMSYTSDENDTLKSDLTITYNTADMASEARSLFEDDELDNVDIDISIDDTTVTIKQEATVEDIIAEINALEEEYDNYLEGSGNAGGIDDDWEDNDDWEEDYSANFDQDDNTVTISVESLESGSSLVVDDSFGEYTVNSDENVDNEWADADSVGQRIVIEDVMEDDYIEVHMVDSESEELSFSTVVDYYMAD